MLTNLTDLKNELAPELSINMYDEPCLDDMPLSRVCKIAEDRLQILKRIQHFFERRKEDENRDPKFYKSLSNELEVICKKYTLFNSKKDDLVSHWILKTAFSMDNEDNFFIFYEKILFSARIFRQATKQVDSEILKPQKEVQTNPHPDEVEPEVESQETEENRSRLFFSMLCEYIGINPKSTKKVEKFNRVKKNEKFEYESKLERYVMIPFRFALKAMEKYDVEMHNGRCQVTAYSSFMIIQDLFEETLKIHRDSVLRSYNSMLRSDHRMLDVIQSIVEYKKKLDENIEIYYDKKEKFDNLTADSISRYAIRYFPLCMLEIHDSLRKNHSLKHWGRLQFGMFLKGVGLEVKETIRLFTTELKRSGTKDKQEKEYIYYVQHMYGLQGKKTDYSAWSCQKIMGKAPPSSNEHYGCPFVYYSEKALVDVLKSKKNLEDGEIQMVLESKKVDPTLACRKVFELTHPGVEMRKGIGKHPNSYFSASYWYNEKNGPVESNKS